MLEVCSWFRRHVVTKSLGDRCDRQTFTLFGTGRPAAVFTTSTWRCWSRCRCGISGNLSAFSELPRCGSSPSLRVSQELVEAKYAFVLHTVNPFTKDTSSIFPKKIPRSAWSVIAASALKEV